MKKGSRPLLFAGAVVMSSAAAIAQPAFDVVSIKPSQIARAGGEGSGRERIDVTPTRIALRNASLSVCIQWAYGVKFYQVLGPGWLIDRRFDVLAGTSRPTGREQLRLMLRAALADRFKLALHRETRTLPVYELVAGKNWTGLREANTDEETGIRVEAGNFVFQRTSMAEFAEDLSDLAGVGRPVLDRTGIRGEFDFALKSAARPGPDAAETAIFAAVEQLGLKLQARKAPLEVLVVDHVERVPTEN